MLDAHQGKEVSGGIPIVVSKDLESGSAAISTPEGSAVKRDWLVVWLSIVALVISLITGALASPFLFEHHAKPRLIIETLKATFAPQGIEPPPMAIYMIYFLNEGGSTATNVELVMDCPSDIVVGEQTPFEFIRREWSHGDAHYLTLQIKLRRLVPGENELFSFRHPSQSGVPGPHGVHRFPVVTRVSSDQVLGKIEGFGAEFLKDSGQ